MEIFLPHSIYKMQRAVTSDSTGRNTRDVLFIWAYSLHADMEIDLCLYVSLKVCLKIQQSLRDKRSEKV